MRVARRLAIAGLGLALGSADAAAQRADLSSAPPPDGPRVTVSARFAPFASARFVDASFHAYDDAYVLVGHVGPDGDIRVVFPRQPGDDGFMRRGDSHSISNVVAGRTTSYFARYSAVRS